MLSSRAVILSEVGTVPITATNPTMTILSSMAKGKGLLSGLNNPQFPFWDSAVFGQLNFYFYIRNQLRV